MHVMEKIRPGERIAGPETIQLPAGYTIEPWVEKLNYPSAVSWDVDGNMLVAESHFPYGRSTAATESRILRYLSDGTVEAVASADLEDLITDITVYQGMLYVSHRGKISVLQDGHLRDLITGLPSWGMHHNNAIVFDQAGRMYFGQGTVSNSGVVDTAALNILESNSHLEAHDIPGADVILAGKNYESTNPLTHETRTTGAFVPWGTVTSQEQRIAGPGRGQAASGAIMRANGDGTDLHVFAWGFRNPFGLAFGPDGMLYVTNNGANQLPPRPVANDPDTLWRVQEGHWYGWPDFFAGKPITEPEFQPAGGPKQEFLLANHKDLLLGRDLPASPLATFGHNVSADKFDFCLHPEFGFHQQAFVAEFGPMLAVLAGEPPDKPGGRKVVRVDMAQGAVSDFAVNRQGPPSQNGNQGGLERPVEAKFGPDGSLYVVDYGVMEWADNRWEATAGTGIVWRITHS